MKNQSCVSIPPSLYDGAAKLIAASFFDNPAHIYLCPDENTRMGRLTWLLGTNIRLQLAFKADSFCLVEDNTVKAMGFWTNPNQVKIGIWDKVKAGLLKIPFKMGWSTFIRVMEVSDKIDEQLARSLGNKIPYYYLNNMVVQENLRGQGLGGRILREQLDIIQSREEQPVFALSTQRLWTVRFYEKLGFEVILEEVIGKGPLAFTNWIMKKT